MTARTCGDCSLCCKLPSIAVLDKPADTWCPHCKPGHGGCTIYSERPDVCVKFECEWLKGDVEEIWNPQSSKMICFLSSAGNNMTIFNVYVDPGWPKRWREKRYYDRLRQIAAVGRLHRVLVRVQVGSRTWMMLPDREVEVPSNIKGFDVFPRAMTWELKWFYSEPTSQESNDGQGEDKDEDKGEEIQN